MEKYIVVSFSGGKDSTAMLLRLMELGEPINEVIWCDTYKEFPAMYRHVEKIKELVEAAGIKFTMLKSDYSLTTRLAILGQCRGCAGVQEL